MYVLGPPLWDESVGEGTTLLVRGRTMTRKTDVTIRLLAGDDDGDTGTVLVTTDERPASLWERYRGLAPNADPSRVGIVDATGETGGGDRSVTDATESGTFSADGAGTPAVVSVNSPADLTGIGMMVSRSFEELLNERGVGRIRLGLATLNTMAMYADAERITRFVHVMSRRIASIGGLGLVVVHTDGLEGGIGNSLPALVDGLVDIREADDGLEARTRNFGAEGDWRPIDPAEPVGGSGSDAAGGTTTPTSARPPESLGAAVRAVEAERPTLTLCNYEEGDAAHEDEADALRSYFESRDVTVRTARLDTETPRGVALLHREEALLAATPIADLADAVAVDESSLFADGRQPAVVEALSGDARAAGGVDRAFLVEASRVVETRAARTSGGRLDAGFQSLSRLWAVPRTRRIYEALAEVGVDVHVYGVADATTPPDTAITVHASDDPEIRDTWFVVHDGAGADERAAALVAEERDPGVYHGFWTRTPDRVAALSTYVVDTHCH
jgi:DICT domain-containing protein/KaiC/GvpD/RAD55 family RecA-like ATPase